MSCTLSPLPNNANNDENYMEDTVIEEKSTLFIKNENEESYVFNTNSKTYLKNNGYLERIGSNKDGYWKVVD